MPQLCQHNDLTHYAPNYAGIICQGLHKAAYLAFEVDWFEDVLLTNGANVVPTLQQLVSATDPVVQLQGGKFNNGTVSFSRYNMGSLFVRCVGLNVESLKISLNTVTQVLNTFIETTK